MDGTIKTKYILGFLEERKETLKEIHRTSDSDKEKIQMLCRIEEIERMMEEIKNIENVD